MQMPFPNTEERSPELLLAGQSITPPSAASQLPGFPCPAENPPFASQINAGLGRSAGAEGAGHPACPCVPKPCALGGPISAPSFEGHQGWVPLA